MGGKIDIKNIIFVFSILFFTKKKFEGGDDDDDELIGGENAGKRIFYIF